MRIAVAREVDPVEDRVAATPETVKKMKGLGAEVAVEPGAGTKSGIPDAEFAAAGATVAGRRPEGRRCRAQGAPAGSLRARAATSGAPSSSPSWIPMARTQRSRPWPMPASPPSRWS